MAFPLDQGGVFSQAPLPWTPGMGNPVTEGLSWRVCVCVDSSTCAQLSNAGQPGQPL